MESQAAHGSISSREASAPPHIRYQAKLFPGSSHTWAFREARRLRQTGHLSGSSPILDIGAGSGVMGALLKADAIGESHAVEIDAVSAKEIAPNYKSVGPSLDAYEGQTFDLILLLDVLEHTAEPLTFLKSATQKLSAAGTILLSVPNVAHWSVRLMLLCGFFPYAERGILDKTHLQFFTRSRIKAVCAEAGLAVCSADSSIAPLELLLPSFAVNNPLFRLFGACRLFAARIFPGLFAFQHLLMLKKRP